MECRQRQNIGTEEDSIHELGRTAQVTILRLSTGHCQLTPLPSPQTGNLPLRWMPMWQRFSNPLPYSAVLPNFRFSETQTWPSPVGAHRKLWGPVETLGQTMDFALLAGLKIYHDRERRRNGLFHSQILDQQCQTGLCNWHWPCSRLLMGWEGIALMTILLSQL